MTSPDGSASLVAVAAARRVLLRQQAHLLIDALPWLSDPDCIPSTVLGEGARGHLEPSAGCFLLARWMVTEVVIAAHRVRHDLSWADVMERHSVPSELQASVRGSVLESVTRYGPGILALSEIVASTPVLAVRVGAARSDWPGIARRSQDLGERLSRNGTDLQVVIRRYLHRRMIDAAESAPALDPARLRLNEDRGVTSVTPIDELVLAAKESVRAHIGPPQGVCLALVVPGPDDDRVAGYKTLFDAVWAAYVSAAARFIFPRVDPARLETPEQSGPDPGVRQAIDRITRERATELARRSPRAGHHGDGHRGRAEHPLAISRQR